MSRTVRTSVTLALAAILLALAALPVQAARPSKEFFGIQPINRPSDAGYAALGKARIGTFRTTFFWSVIQPVPGVFSWGDTDDVVRSTAKNGVTVSPVLFGTPDWAGRETKSPCPTPRPGCQHDRPPATAAGKAAYYAYVREVARRYGPNGAFWKQNPGVPKKPIKVFQVWNEPNLAQFWPCVQRFKRVRGKRVVTSCRPKAREYATFTTRATRAIKSVNRKAKVTLAGLPETKFGSPLIRYLTDLYRVKNFKNAFDAVAIHPYAKSATDVKGAVVAVRKVMTKGKDSRTPLYLSELGWSSGGNNRIFSVGDRKMAQLLTQSYRFLTSTQTRKKYRIGQVVWFTFQDRGPDGTYAADAWQRQAGLFRENGAPKRAWTAMLKFTRGKTSGKIGPGSVGASAGATAPPGPEGQGTAGEPEPPADGGGGGGGGGTPPTCTLPGGVVCP